VRKAGGLVRSRSRTGLVIRVSVLCLVRSRSRTGLVIRMPVLC